MNLRFGRFAWGRDSWMNTGVKKTRRESRGRVDSPIVKMNAEHRITNRKNTRREKNIRKRLWGEEDWVTDRIAHNLGFTYNAKRRHFATSDWTVRFMRTETATATATEQQRFGAVFSIRFFFFGRGSVFFDSVGSFRFRETTPKVYEFYDSNILEFQICSFFYRA